MRWSLVLFLVGSISTASAGCLDHFSARELGSLIRKIAEGPHPQACPVPGADHAAQPMLTPEKKKLLLEGILREMIARCQEDEKNELYHFLLEFFKKNEGAIKSGETYDSIVIGGGVAGTAAALAMGRGVKTLVIEKNEWPSVFGNAGAFFLNLNPIQLENSPHTLREFSSKTLLGGHPAGYSDALAMSKNLIVDLFYSGADILLNTKAVEIHWVKPLLYRVTDSRGRTFFTSHVILSSGLQGVNLNGFKDPNTRSLLEKELSEGSIDSVEMLLQSIRKDPRSLGRFTDKSVAVIGGRDGGSSAVMGLMGFVPSELTPGVGGELEPKVKRAPYPHQIHWFFNPDNRLFRNRPQKILEQDFYKNGYLEYPGDVQKIEKIGGQYRIDVPGSKNSVLVDHLILATGYSTDPLALLSPEAKAFSEGITTLGAAGGIFKTIEVIDANASAEAKKILVELPKNPAQERLKVLRQLNYLRSKVQGI